jgi:hypothetical protein
MLSCMDGKLSVPQPILLGVQRAKPFAGVRGGQAWGACIPRKTPFSLNIPITSRNVSLGT